MRLIDADALKAEIEKALDNAGLSEYEACICVTSIYDKCIDNAQTFIWCSATPEGLPLMDLRERPKGEWIADTSHCYDEDEDTFECSVCKEPFTLICGTPEDNLYNFCPNCGADMRKGGAE